MKRHPFTPSEEKYMRENFGEISSREMARKLECSRSKVQNFFKRNNMKMSFAQKEKLRAKGLTGKTTFTPAMDKFLKENYLTIPVKPLGEQIGKSYCGVMTRLRQLGLKIPEEIRAKRKTIGQRKPGDVPANKGKKIEDFMTPEQVAVFKKNQFQKGQKPHNTASGDGAISLRKDTATGITYKYIRVKMGEWELYSRFLWQKHRGPIPKNHVIRFKNGNSLDCRIENLECVSMAKNLELNWHIYPESLKKVIKLTHKIQKQL